MTIQLLNKIDSLQAILFDFDGVLCECMDVKTEAFAQLFEPFGEDVVKKVVEHHVNHGGISRYKKIEYYYKKYLNQEISNDDVNKIAQKFSDLVVEKVKPYLIPYRSMVACDVDNLLLAGRCISGDFRAHGSYRTTSDCAVMGEVAGRAAALAADKGILPKDVSPEDIKVI